MLDQEINAQLGLLEEELNKLKKVTDYLDGVKDNSVNIISELGNIQQNYTVYTDKIFKLYKQQITDLKASTETQINEGVYKFETTGNKIDTTNRQKLTETKRLLDQHKEISEATDGLVTKISQIDFPARLSKIDSMINNMDSNSSENHKMLMKKLELQEKEIKLHKTLLYVICGLIIIGAVTGIII
ncbi:hypothetical protein VS868_11720 [Salinimicrobium sp. 3283s]|uniref:hypothetical protein n=1 Tax=Salinimicrobium sp. 3283s TaxID=3114359 RepID=UPI0031EE6CFB